MYHFEDYIITSDTGTDVFYIYLCVWGAGKYHRKTVLSKNNMVRKVIFSRTKKASWIIDPLALCQDIGNCEACHINFDNKGGVLTYFLMFSLGDVQIWRDISPNGLFSHHLDNQIVLVLDHGAYLPYNLLAPIEFKFATHSFCLMFFGF